MATKKAHILDTNSDRALCGARVFQNASARTNELCQRCANKELLRQFNDHTMLVEEYRAAHADRAELIGRREEMEPDEYRREHARVTARIAGLRLAISQIHIRA